MCASIACTTPLRPGAGVGRVTRRPGLVATMSFGRPVQPPLVTTFHSGERTAGAANRAAAVSPAVAATSATTSTGRPPAPTSATSAATTSAGSASSMIAARSAAGSREEIG
jgi:hypothetical protein